MRDRGVDPTARVQTWDATPPGRVRSPIERIRRSLAWKLGLAAGVLYIVTPFLIGLGTMLVLRARRRDWEAAA